MKVSKWFSLLFFFSGTAANGQLSIDWQKCLGGPDYEHINEIQQTSDQGFITCGRADTEGGDLQGPFIGGGDFWIVKLDAEANIKWQQILGGTSNDVPYSICQTSDGGYIVAGVTESNDVNVSGHHGLTDYWVVKLSKSGWLEWQKTYGGSSVEECNAVRQTTDGGYILAGKSASKDGDVSGNHGYFDYWIVKTDPLGNIEWEKSYGGSNGVDEAHSINLTTDGGYIIGGWTNSKNGDVSGNHGNIDYWIVKIDNLGNLQWQKALGGVGADQGYWVVQTQDKGYIAIGAEGSGNTGNVSGHHGGVDVWVVKLDSIGQIIWQKALGGTETDNGEKVFETEDGHFLVAGTSLSSNGDVHAPNGNVDLWAVELDEQGTLVWEKAYGGSDLDDCLSAAPTVDGGMVMAGYVYSNDGYVSGNHGFSDGWILKLSPQSTKTHLPQPTRLTLYPNPTTQSITLRLPDNELLTSIQITDLSGKTLKYLLPSSDNTLPVAELPKGMYLLKALSASGTAFCGKFIRE